MAPPSSLYEVIFRDFFQFTQSPPTEKKLTTDQDVETSHSRKPWESNFFMGSFYSCCCALFSHEFKARNRKKSSKSVEIEIN